MHGAAEELVIEQTMGHLLRLRFLQMEKVWRDGLQDVHILVLLGKRIKPLLTTTVLLLLLLMLLQQTGNCARGISGLCRHVRDTVSHGIH